MLMPLLGVVGRMFLVSGVIFSTLRATLPAQGLRHGGWGKQKHLHSAKGKILVPHLPGTIQGPVWIQQRRRNLRLQWTHMFELLSNPEWLFLCPHGAPLEMWVRIALSFQRIISLFFSTSQFWHILVALTGQPYKLPAGSQMFEGC